MSELIKSSLQKLKLKKISNPELDLRVLINNSKTNNKEIFLSNFSEKDIDIKKFYLYLERRLKHEPISKIINKKNFWKYDFYVNKDVLDPRPETELILEESLNLIKNKKKRIDILDIGTGSGCLAISLAKEFINSKILAVDISKKAVAIANKNIYIHKSASQIITKVISFDRINNYFDLIVSNPPYLSSSEYYKTNIEVKNFDPKVALLGGSNGLLFYKKFAKKLPHIMKKNSYLILEIGEKQASKCIQLFINSGLKFVKKTKDLQKKDRILLFSRV
tara:strand:- start:3 stop:833 length:831 start_codon:yes stop_codon:yes gene_type:complete